MKKIIVRNIAIITAIFMVTLSIMLIVNYFQAKEVSPLQTQVIETLKQINDQNAGNEQLQDQIRQLDLMSRKAFFLNSNQLERGVYILLGMLVVLIVCLRIYFAQHKNIPDKELDPIDEWAIKTKARKYVGIVATSLAALAILFAALSMPLMKISDHKVTTQNDTTIQSVANTADVQITEDQENALPQESVEAEVTAATTEDVKSEIVESESQVNEKTSKTETTEIKIVNTNVGSSVNSNSFRGENSNGITKAKNIPVKWDLQNKTNIAWRTEIPLKGQSSPIIHGNKVYITGASDQARTLFCYDLNTGKLVWSVDAKNISGSPGAVPKTSDDTGLASSTAATNGTQVCAIFATGDLICTDTDGNLLWAKNLGVPENHYGYASSLLMLDNQLFIQYDNRNTHKLIALNTINGNELWVKEREDKITWSSPILAYINNQPVLILMGNPNITAYNPANGEQLWKVKCLTGEVGASACSANGIVFGASEYAKMVAINGTDGSVIWEATDYLPEASSPVATATDVYIATSYGVVAAFDVKTGKLKKQHETNAAFYSSLILAEGKIFLFSNDGTMHIFSADSDFNLLDSFKTGEKTFATPAFTDNKIVVRTEQSIYCVKAN